MTDRAKASASLRGSPTPVSEPKGASSESRIAPFATSASCPECGKQVGVYREYSVHGTYCYSAHRSIDGASWCKAGNTIIGTPKSANEI